MTNLNLLTIHARVLYAIRQKEKPLSLKKHELALLRASNTHSPRHARAIVKLQEEVHEMESHQKLHFFVMQTAPILAQYREELQKPIRVSLSNKHVDTVRTTIIDQLVHKYMTVSRSLDITIHGKYDTNVSDTKRSVACTTCDENMTAEACPDCGVENGSPRFMFSYKDVDRVNVTNKYTYERLVHFRDCMMQFQGKQNSTIPQAVYDFLHEQIADHKLIREGDLPHRVKYERVTKKHILLFLKDKDFSKHYENVTLIHHKITGHPCPDISYLEEKLIHDFTILSALYDEMFIKQQRTKRKNFVNTQFVLFELLQRHRYACRKEDFNFMKTVERLEFTEDVCSKLFAWLGWNFTFVI